MMQAALPMMSAAHVDGRTTPDFQQTLKMTQSIMVAVAFPVATALMFGSGFILHVYGRGFRGGESVVTGLVATTLIQCIGATTGTAIEARGKMWTGLLLNSSWAISYLGFVYLTITRLESNSLAFGLLASYTIVTLWTFFYLETRHLLPDGMLKRGLLSITLVFTLVAFVLLCSAPLRLLFLLPATMLVTWMTFTVLTDRGLMSALGLRSRTNTTIRDELNECAELTKP
jgi:O-antigen/teichoic acid export membrane protein